MADAETRATTAPGGLVEHWEKKYATDPTATTFSWSQERPSLDLELVRAAIGDRKAEDLVFMDVGGGASHLSELVKSVLGVGTAKVIDLSMAAMQLAQAHAKGAGIEVQFEQANVLEYDFGAVDIWHDRAVLHFLSEDGEVAKYVQQATAAVRPGGSLIIGTFDEDGGPVRCSNLPVRRWGMDGLAAAFRGGFDLVSGRKEVHTTPGGSKQKFVFVHLRRHAGGAA